MGRRHIFFGGDNDNPTINGAIHVHSSIMKNVVSSAAEAEVGALFHNAHDACSFRQTLEDLGHQQPPTLLRTDNACANGIMNRTVKQKRSKAIDMRYYWLQDRVDQRQFRVHWQPGSTNQADYFTKHHSPAHHIEMRPTYMHPCSNNIINKAAALQENEKENYAIPALISSTSTGFSENVALHDSEQQNLNSHISSCHSEGVLKSPNYTSSSVPNI